MPRNMVKSAASLFLIEWAVAARVDSPATQPGAERLVDVPQSESFKSLACGRLG